MEKPARSKGNIFSFLPRATPVTFHKHNPPISPGRDMRTENWNRLKANAGKGFSGPVISIIPAEARRKSRSGNFDAEEPTSPKVSCMGQIKHKHKQKKLKNKNQKKLISKPNTQSDPRDFCKLESSLREEKKKPSSTILRIFGNRRKCDNPNVFEDLDREAPVQVQVQGMAPSLGHMKRFASGRDSLANFDWSTQIPVASDDQNYHEDGGDSGGKGGKMA